MDKGDHGRRPTRKTTPAGRAQQRQATKHGEGQHGEAETRRSSFIGLLVGIGVTKVSPGRKSAAP